jgi:two-component system LytT family response regulator
MNGLDFIYLDSVVRIESKGDYCRVILDKGGQIMATRTIREYEDVLPQALFCRIHNSHIINLKKVVQYEKGRGGHVVLADGARIKVAVRRRLEFIRRLLK